MDKMYQKYYSEFYLKEAGFSNEHFEREYRRLSTFMHFLLPEDKSKRIIELGSGVGFLLYYLQKRGYSNFHGVDISEEAVELCKKHITENVSKDHAVSFLQNQLEKRLMADCIIAFDTLEHFEKKDILDIFDLCYALLNPNGTLVIKVGNMAHITGSQLFYHDFTHITGFTEGSLRHLFFQSGFKKVEFYHQKPVQFISKIKYYIERCLHQWIYAISRVQCPENTGRKIIAIGKKIV